MCNQRTFGSKLSYDQWRFLSGGNILGYEKYGRRYEYSKNQFYKKHNVKHDVGFRKLQVA